MLSQVPMAPLVTFSPALVAETRVPQASTRNRLPAPGGPFQVGKASFDLVDLSRSDPFSANPAIHRELMVTVWYPACQVRPGTPRSPYVPDAGVFAQYLGSGSSSQEVDELRQYLESMQTNSYQGARLAPGPRTLPVVIFMPGWGAVPEMYSSYAEDLASRGYVVAAINPTGISRVTMFADGRVVGTEVPEMNLTTMTLQQFEAAAARETDVMASDAQFVLSEFAKMNAGLIPSAFRGRLDLGHVAAVGQSMGGAAAAQLVATTAQFRVGVDLDGTLWGPTQTTGVNRPFLFMRSSPLTSQELRQRGITRNEYQKQQDQDAFDTKAVVATIRAGGARVIVDGFRHMDFSDQELRVKSSPDGPCGVRGVRIVERFVASFLRANLFGRRSPLFHRQFSPFRGVEFSNPIVA
ncbi:MAG: hypothetical protein U0790_01955 [Isosphaeraceae bacterium]